MEFVILKIILLLAILVLPLFGPPKKKKLTKQNYLNDKKLADYCVNEDGNLEEIKKKATH